MCSLRVLLFCLLLIPAAQAANDKSFFWKISSYETEVYLLGSIHFGNDSFYPLRKTITDSFDAADYLVVEVNLSDFNPADYVELVNRYGRYPEGVTISDHLSDSTYQRLRRVLKSHGLPENSMDAMRPGMVIVDLSSLVMLRSGFAPEKGIDMVMMKRAAKKNKPVLALESVEQQIRMLSSLPEPELLISETLDEIENFEAELRELETSWKQGDEVAIVEMLIDGPEQKNELYRKINEMLLYQRNRNMLKQLEQFLGTGDTYFVVVGAAHLLGEQGLVKLLDEAGFDVQRH